MKISRKIYKQLIKFLGLGLILSVGIGYLFFYHLVHCYLIAYSSFAPYPSNVYISSKMPKSLVPSIEVILKEAKQRNQAFWGELKSLPTFIFCIDDQEFSHFGQNYGTPAMVHLTAQGVYIIIKPDGVNLDVISHELCHAEFFARVGWYAKIHKIPAWFDEGLALQLDYRYPGYGSSNHFEEYQQKWLIYTRQGQDSLKLSELAKIKDFFKSDNYYTNLAYLTSGREVARWLDKVGKKGLEQLIKKMKAGEDFQTAYKKIENGL